MTRMIDPVDGTHIPCHWEDCWRAGDTQHEVVIREKVGVDPRNVILMPVNKSERWKDIHFLFCCERHKEYWLYSHVSLYNLPVGSKGMLI